MSLQIGNQREDGDDEEGSTVMEDEDLLLQILLFLPPKPLLRFKSVSKNWQSIISSTQFHRHHGKRLCKDISGLVLRRSYIPSPEYEFLPLADGANPPFKSLDFVEGETRLDAVQYCNGLLLCKSKEKADCNCKYYVINPTTKQYTAVSVSVNQFHDFEVYSVSLAFDPRESPHFKLVCLYWSKSLRLCPDDNCFGIYIYSSETGVMTQSGETFHTKAGILAGLYWNGAVNWINYMPGDGLYFNVDKERLGILPMPDGGNEFGKDTGRWIRYYGESNDRLFFVQTESLPTAQFNVYEMDKGYSGWFQRYLVDLRPVFQSFPEAINVGLDPLHVHRYSFGILAVVDKDDDGKSFLVLSTHGKAIRFDFRDKSFSKVLQVSPRDKSTHALPLHTWQNSFQFIESLHPL